MSSGEESRGSAAPQAPTPTKASSPALWGLVGVLSGSLVSGVFSMVAAQKSYDAAINTAAKSQETNERTLEETRSREREVFLREQRVSVFTQLLTDAQLAEAAYADYLTVLSSPAAYPDPSDYYSQMELSYRQYVSSAWSAEFFSPEEVKSITHALNREIDALHSLFTSFDGTAEAVPALSAQFSEGQTKIQQMREQFAAAVSRTVSS
jgi:methyl-accepting chemotaxis protein